MKELDNELWKLENYSIANLKGKTISYTRNGFIYKYIYRDTYIRNATIIDIDKDREHIKIDLEETNFRDWIPVKNIKIISIKERW